MQRIGYTSDKSQTGGVEVTQGLARARSHYYPYLEGQAQGSGTVTEARGPRPSTGNRTTNGPALWEPRLWMGC